MDNDGALDGENIVAELPEISNQEGNGGAAVDCRCGFNAVRGARSLFVRRIDIVHFAVASVGDLYAGRLELPKQGRIGSIYADRPSGLRLGEGDGDASRGTPQLKAFGRGSCGGDGTVEGCQQKQKGGERIMPHVVLVCIIPFREEQVQGLQQC